MRALDLHLSNSQNIQVPSYMRLTLPDGSQSIWTPDRQNVHETHDSRLCSLTTLRRASFKSKPELCIKELVHAWLNDLLKKQTTTKNKQKNKKNKTSTFAGHQ